MRLSWLGGILQEGVRGTQRTTDKQMVPQRKCYWECFIASNQPPCLQSREANRAIPKSQEL